MIGSLVTIAALIGLGVVGYMVYQNRDRFFPSENATPVAVKKLSEEAERKFFEARDDIVTGKYDDASAILKSLDTDSVPQPTRNWITVQNGLARLLAGRLPEARAEFGKVEQRGPFTKDPRQEKLAKFFVASARLAASEEPVKNDAAKDFEPDSTEAFAFLVFGLKDWNLGQFDDASFFFRQFKSASPPESEIWLRRYRSLADAYVESYTAFTAATDAAKDAGSPERKEQALAAIREAKVKVKNQPGLVAKLSEIEGELKTQVDAANAEMSKKTALAEAGDQKLLDEVKTRVAGFNEKFNFGDANQIIFTATAPNGDKARAEFDKLSKRTKWLARFKSVLISDINAANGYPKPLPKKDGTTIATGVKSVDDSELTIAPKVKVQWPDLTFDALVAMAKEFVEKTKEPEGVAERKWLLGNFLYELGRKPEALALLREAAPTKPEYKDGLPVFADGEAK
ncbi:MAG TPA: hypothetical protein VEO95_11245 [Chthoniobacteraceae bacterium]|nr:hypothetical protein [Chthoniobacteraceae bacterium]